MSSDRKDYRMNSLLDIVGWLLFFLGDVVLIYLSYGGNRQDVIRTDEVAVVTLNLFQGLKNVDGLDAETSSA